MPPCINKYYILDLQPENFFVRYAVGEGHTVFMVSWRNIPSELGGLTWDDYLEQGVLAALDVGARDRRQQDGQRARILRRRHAAGLRAGGACGAPRDAESPARRSLQRCSTSPIPATSASMSRARRLRRACRRCAAGGRIQGSELRQRIRKPADRTSSSGTTSSATT